MSLNHGINTYKSDTNFAAVKLLEIGIPFFVGAWPCHAGNGFAGKPQIAYNFPEAEKIGGYSSEWRDASGNPKWSLCQAMYSQFRVFELAPAIFYNVYDPAKHKKAVASASMAVTDHIVMLSADVIDDADLVIKDGDNTLVKGTDYEVIYDSGRCVIELLPGGTHYSAATLDIAYNEADLSTITAADIEAGIEKIEDCKALFGVVPDLICCPGWSQTPSVATVMAVKAASINGLFKGKAVVDLDTSSAGADAYDKVEAYKKTNGYTDENMIVCWPLVIIGGYLYDYSVVVCGKIAEVDQANGDCPYESPSNKSIPISGCVNKAGEEIALSPPQADVVSYNAGVVTAINFDGWKLWGNYTGCWPKSNDVARYFICTNRTHDWICNTFITLFWTRLDGVLTRVKIDAIVNSFNSWLNGLTHDEKIYGGEIQYVPENNPTADLIGGIIRLDTKEASPVPMQKIDMHTEFDVNYLVAALSA